MHWKWKDFPELLSEDQLWQHIRDCPDAADTDVIKAVKTFCKTQLDDTTPAYNHSLLKTLMRVYDAEAQKGIEDKEIFSILYKARFSPNSKVVRENMQNILESLHLTAPKLKELCKTSYGVLRWKLRPSTNEK